MSTALQQYQAWTKDWTAFQQANGIRPSAPAAAPKKGGQ
jgi:hypothetical protein